VVDLPKGATPLDFAYTIHTEVGHRCRGAKVDGRIVPLTYSLRSGQRVEVLTTRQGGPSRDWINPSMGYLRTSRARAKARSWFRLQDHDRNLAEGRSIVDRECHRMG
jgi:GTP pyrophosphokinase